MANVDLVLRLLAEDRASDKFKKVGDSASVAEKRLGKFSKVAAGISAAAITAFAVSSVKAFADAEQQQVKLEGAYKRFPKIADVSITSLRAMNSELQKTTKYDDDAVAGAQAVLAQFNLTGKQIEQVTPLLLDYASATGKSVSEAATSLGKSLLGQTRALKEVGINYKSTGDAGKDFANITDLLSQKVGGFAKNEGKSAAGQLAILENQFGDLQETVGSALVPALSALVNVATPMVSTLGKLPAPVLAGGLAVGALGAATLLAVPKVLAFKAAISQAGISGAAMGKSVKGAGKALGAIGVVMAAAGAYAAYTDEVINAGKSTDDLATSLKDLSSGGTLGDLALGFKTSDGAAQGFGESLGNVADNHWWDQLGQGVASLVGVDTTFNLAKQSIDGVDQALASIVSGGDATAAALAFSKLADEAMASGISVDDLKAALPQYAAAQAAATKPVTAATIELRKQGDAVKTVEHAFKVLQGILDRGAAQDAWVSALKGIGKAAQESGGLILGNRDAAIKLRDQVRDDVGALTTYAEGFKNPAKKAEVMRDGLLSIRDALVKGGVKRADVDKFLNPLIAAAGDGYVKAKNIGKSINDGLVAGLKDRAAAMAEARSLGEAAVRAVQKGAQVNSPSEYTTWVGGQIADGLTVGIKARAGQSKKAIEDLTAQSLSAAGKLLDKWKAKADATLSRYKSVRDDIVGSGSVASFRGSEDTPTTSANVLSNMAGRVSEAKRFVSAIKSLAALGLNKTSIREIIAAGPHDGLAIAEALLSGGGISEVNALESQLALSGQALGGFAAQMDTGITVTQALGGAKVVSAQASAGGTVAVNLIVDGKTLQSVLVNLKQAQGGRLNF